MLKIRQNWSRTRIAHKATVGVFGVLLACSGGGGGGGGSPDRLAGNSPDDDMDVAQAVPMALMDGSFIAEVRHKLGQGIASGKYEARPYESPIDDEPGDYPVALDILSASGKASGEMSNLLLGFQGLLENVFGQNGLFKGETLNFYAHQKSRTFVVDDGGISHISLNIHDEDDEHPYGLDLWVKLDNGQLERRTALAFTPINDGAGAKVTYSHTVYDSTLEKWQRLEGKYDTVAGSIEANFGFEDPISSIPARSTVRVDIDRDAERLTVSGAYVWRNMPAPPEGFIPRYYSPQSNDIEAFQLHARSGEKQSVQRLAFIPAEQLAGIANPSSPAIFANNTYPPHMMDFLRQILRHPDINDGCSTSGDALRTAVAGYNPVPAWAATLPDNLCQANTDVSNALVETVISDVCNGGTDIVLSITVGGGPPTPYSLCDRQYEELLLSNPQYFTIENDQRLLVLWPDQPDHFHDQLVIEMNEKDFMDLSILTEQSWEDLLIKDVSDLGTIEELP